ncbi:TatD family hydrolase [Robertkochia sediminum]|uniref:TatD family hydrolase n=1 Tax=Robertkochia sediminum TaxID=2785326 RepID=UPI0019329613|nr:TatD family hydrolase [Robertkochia sediminum]MBL7473885.1 TatD family hydrolase [Robertkochia sediminum]
MILTDTHTHLYSEAFDEDRDSMMQRALDAGVERFFIPAIDASYIPSMLQLKKDFPDHIYLMAGLHPTHVKENFREELEQARQMMEAHKVYAVGETGIDLYWDKTFVKEQQEAFHTQIGWAKEKGLPVVIHCRDAFEEVFEVLEDEKDDKLFGIFHCFTGTEAHAQRAIDCNMKLGIGGVVTFKNGKIDKFLGDFPIEHMVLETDSPYLAPVPYRGKRNESAYLLQVAEKMAQIYGLSVEEVARITTENSQTVFGI